MLQQNEGPRDFSGGYRAPDTHQQSASGTQSLSVPRDTALVGQDLGMDAMRQAPAPDKKPQVHEPSSRVERAALWAGRSLEQVGSGILDAVWGPRGGSTEPIINFASLALGFAAVSRPMGLAGLFIGVAGVGYGLFRAFRPARFPIATESQEVGRVLGAFGMTLTIMGQAMAIRDLAYKLHRTLTRK